MMEIFAYEEIGGWSKTIRITYDSGSETDRAEAEKFVSRIIPPMTAAEEPD